MTLTTRHYSNLEEAFLFNGTGAGSNYTLSLHDALPIWRGQAHRPDGHAAADLAAGLRQDHADGVRRRDQDRKSTRLNSSHMSISYAVFCLKKKIKIARSDQQESRARCCTPSSAGNKTRT